MECTWFNLSRLGLLYDIAGGFVLGWGLMSAKFGEARLFWREDPELSRLAYGKVDTLFGVFLLMVGFAAQLLGSEPVLNLWFLHLGPSASCGGLLTLAILSFLFFAIRGWAMARLKTIAVTPNDKA